jgi:hypothetical protein
MGVRKRVLRLGWSRVSSCRVFVEWFNESYVYFHSRFNLGSSFSYALLYNFPSRSIAMNDSTLLASAELRLASLRQRTVRILTTTLTVLRTAIPKRRPWTSNPITTASIRAGRQSAASKLGLTPGCYGAVVGGGTAVSVLRTAVTEVRSLTCYSVSALSVLAHTWNR